MIMKSRIRTLHYLCDHETKWNLNKKTKQTNKKQEHNDIFFSCKQGSSLISTGKIIFYS